MKNLKASGLDTSNIHWTPIMSEPPWKVYIYKSSPPDDMGISIP